MAVAIATTVPYLAAWSSTGDGEVYTWLNFNSTDSNQYFAWIREGAEGNLLFADRFTSEPTPRRLLKPFFLAVGLLSKVMGDNIPLAYHLARVALCIAITHVLYWFASIFLLTTRERLAAAILTLTAGGIGLPLGYLGYSFSQRMIEKPIDFWTPEAFVFQILYLYPHLTASLTLILIAAGRGWLAILGGKKADLVLAWLAAFALAFIHPFDLVPIYTLFIALGVYAIVSKRASLKSVILRVGIMGIFSAPPAIAQTLAMRSHPTFLWILENNKQTSLGISQFLTGLGLPVILLVPVLAAGLYYGRDRLKTKERDSLIVPLIYLAVILALAFAPIFSLRRRFIMGMQIPTILVLVWSAARCFDKMKLKTLSRTVVTTIFGLLIIPGSVLKMVDDYQGNIQGKHSIRSSYYYSKDKATLYEKLDEISGDADVVLSDYRTGNELPAYAGVRVFMGHWGHTVKYRTKKAMWRQLLMSKGEAGSMRLESLIKHFGITRVMVLRERDGRSLFGNLTSRQPYLRKEYENQAGILFRVTK